MTKFSKLAAVACSIGLGVCASTAAAQAPATPNAASRRATMPVEGAIANPDWAQMPNGEVLANYYPPFARFLELSGFAKIQCDVTAAGALDACVILEETPAGIGFGEATLAAAQYFRMKPMTVDGAPVAGGKVIIPLNWKTPSSGLPPDPNADGPPPSAEALALGRRVYAATGGASRAAAFYRAIIVARTQNNMGGAAGTPESEAALAAVDKAVDAEVAGYGETMAVEYAKTFSVDELSAFVTFFESPAGQVWRDHDEAMQKAHGYAAQKVWLQILADARRELCAKTACTPTPAAPASAQAKPADADQRARP